MGESILFAQDNAGEGYYSALGGRGTYPYTVVIDAEGKITHIFLEALEYSQLKEAIENSK